ncbi:hypothetical protein GUJ93_ZPchr0003g16613 [Zizania palustris]|uniref:Uncharacterized protein n=1 Tax=Zizania palustris TaxID=103762 RepID=A0A8J5VKI9_ZIZPA|nr:hypothetical protein GUJ93_ZPchr0003g16613 [Zizania palustris]
MLNLQSSVPPDVDVRIKLINGVLETAVVGFVRAEIIYEELDAVTLTTRIIRRIMLLITLWILQVYSILQRLHFGINSFKSVTDAVQLGSVFSSPSCCGDQHGGAVRMAGSGRRMLIGHQLLAKGSMEHAKKEEAVFDEEEREVLTGPNPLHNR